MPCSRRRKQTAGANAWQPKSRLWTMPSPGIDVAELLRGWGIDGVTVHRRAACRTQPGAGCAGGVSDEENGSIPRSLRGFGPRCLAENLRA